MAKKKVIIEKDGAERWLLTYADLMNLLLIFFIVLYSMSKVDAAKFNALASSLKQSLGTNSAQSFIAPGGGATSLLEMPHNATPKNELPIITSDEKNLENKNKQEEAKMEETKKMVDSIIKSGNLGDKIKVTVEERGIKISITANYLFQSGSAEVNNLAFPTIDDISKALLQFPSNSIRVEGHTDNDPINTHEFPSNWELSSARASNVLRQIISKTGINPKNISSVGYGEYQPLVENNSAVNKAINRRVDIIVLRQDYSKSEASSSADNTAN